MRDIKSYWQNKRRPLSTFANIDSSDSALIKAAFEYVVSHCRTQCGFEQREFARATGINNSHLHKIEAGQVSPTLITIEKKEECLHP